MKGRDPEAELLRHLDHGRHLVRPVTMVVDEDVSVEDAGERLHLQIALRTLGRVGSLVAPLLPLVAIVSGGLPRAAEHGDVPHSRRRRLVALPVHTPRIFTARHLQPRRRAGKLHPLRCARRHVLHRDPATADEIPGSWQDLHRRHAAGKRELELRILRPDRMVGPHFRGHRIGHLVAVLQRFDAGRRVDAEMRMGVDDSGRDPFTGGIDDHGVRRSIHALADRGNLAVLEQDRSTFDQRTCRGEDGRVPDHRRSRRQRLISRRICVCHPRRCSSRRGRDRRGHLRLRLRIRRRGSLLSRGRGRVGLLRLRRRFRWRRLLRARQLRMQNESGGDQQRRNVAKAHGVIVCQASLGRKLPQRRTRKLGPSLPETRR